jgi:cytosine/adenosine deaminase-related metal-dependent hydrolase
MTTPLVIDGAAIATVNAAGDEFVDGHLVAVDGRITAIGAGPAPTTVEGARRVNGRGCLLTPGLVNTHHHLYQWATRGYAVNSTLFQWLTELYPVWARINADIVSAAATAGLAWLARSGCTTSTDHHYLFPRGSGDLLASTVDAAGRIGLRFHPTRGSMDLGQSQGGLPPDSVVETLDEILRASQDAVERFHDPSPGAMVRVALAPCSPFSVSGDLLTESAKLARSLGVRLHTHLAETLDEEEYCQDRHGCGPVEYLDRLGWLGDDVWLAHGVHLDPASITRLAETGTGVAHCPSSNARLGSGTAPSRALLDAGVPVGLGVDGAASQEAGRLVDELRQALYAARSRVDGGVIAGPAALTSRQSLAMATIGGAHCLGRQDEIGSLEVGKLADLALWRLDGLGHVGIADPVDALVIGSAPPLELLTVGGRVVVERDTLLTADEASMTAELRRACEEVRP